MVTFLYVAKHNRKGGLYLQLTCKHSCGCRLGVIIAPLIAEVYLPQVLRQPSLSEGVAWQGPLVHAEAHVAQHAQVGCLLPLSAQALPPLPLSQVQVPWLPVSYHIFLGLAQQCSPLLHSPVLHRLSNILSLSTSGHSTLFCVPCVRAMLYNPGNNRTR